ncbi:tautomerase family protein [Roseovarius indicus]|uniref:tautomerase family protein n=1 Tax=Roseovarius indicus TaxID=540747 RepID=UPI0032EF5E0E
MPLIDIHVLEGVFTDEDKERILLKVIDAFGEAAGGRMKENTSARIHEVKSGSWAFGGNVLHTELGQAIRRGD